MKNVFILIEYGGEYDSRFEYNLVASEDKSILEGIVSSHNKKQKGNRSNNRTYYRIEEINLCRTEDNALETIKMINELYS